jgi:hypothetical protein
VILSLGIVLFFVVRNYRIQTHLVKYATEKLAEDMNTNIHVESVKMSLLKRLAFRNVLIEDQKGDTLIYSKKLVLNYRKFDRNKRLLSLRKVTFNEARVNMYKDSANILNMGFFIDHLQEARDTSKKKLSFEIDEMQLVNSRFGYKDMEASPTPDKINFEDLDFKNLNIAIDNFRKARDTVMFTIKNLEFIDQSGFPANHIAGQFAIHKTFIQLNNARIYTPATRLKTDSLFLHFPNFDSLKNGGFVRHANLTIDFKDSRLSLDDLGYFAPVLKEYENKIFLSANIRGTPDNLKLRHTTLYYGENTSLSGNFELKGLPDFENTFMFFDIQRFKTTIEDLESVNLAAKSLSLPKEFNQLGNIEYRGNFTGFSNDFVAYGKLQSSLGSLSTDISLKPTTDKNLSFSGQLQGNDFMIGKLLASDEFGKASFNLSINGTQYANDQLEMKTAGKIDYLEFRDYPIHKIELNGTLSDKKYKGIIAIDDENLALKFNGDVDFSNDTNAYEFYANVSHIQFYNLNLMEDDPELSGSFVVEANVTGNSLNTLNGEINLLNAFFTKSGNKQVQLYDLALTGYNTADSNYLGITSELVDAELHGNYQLDQINSSIVTFINRYAPSFDGKHKLSSKDFKGNFNLLVTIKKIRPLTDFFLPQYDIAENTIIKANYDDHNNSFSSFLTSERLRYKSYVWNKLYVYSMANDSVFEIESGSDYLQLNKNLRLENCTFLSDMRNDSLNLTVRWHNWDTLVNRGTIDASVALEKNPFSENTKYNIDLKPSTVVVRNSKWEIDHANMLIDSQLIAINNFAITHNKQHLNINGSVSKNTTDSIRITCTNYDMSNLNILTAGKGMSLDGRANGYAIITHKNKTPMFISNIGIDSLVMNKEEMGNLKLFSLWNEKEQSLNVSTELYRGPLKSMSLSGQYFPEDNHKISVNLNLDKFRLYTLNPYIQGVFSDMRGLCSGSLAVSGNIKKPYVNGHLKFLKTSFIVDYLGTRYNFSDEITFMNNQMVMEDVSIYDEFGNDAVLNGNITSNHFRDIRLDLSFNTQNWQVLNTTSINDESYYGTAYAGGLFEITGPVNNLDINISARTNPQTAFYIPLDKNEEINEYDFVSFVSPKKDEENEGETYNDANTNQVQENKLTMSFDLQVTPDAEVQIIFDSKIGDIIKGRGDGNLTMTVNNQGQFNMYGDYNITEGEYLFTLKNIINKKFKIREGSVIYWNGNPSNATLDLEAIYSTKTSVEPLFADLGGSESDNLTTQKTQVDCIISLSGKLTSPQIQTSIEFPKANSTTLAALEGRLNNQEAINKQFLALMAVNSFIPDEPESLGAVSRASSVTTTTELLSNQLSHWLSQFSNQFDIGVNYRQANELTQQNWEEVELMVSTQLWEDRVNINVGGNYISEEQYQTAEGADQKIVGDFDMDVKLSKSGKIRFKAFNHYNDQYDNPTSSTYTQGVGFLYQEDFNSLNELFQNYWNIITPDKSKQNQSASP